MFSFFCVVFSVFFFVCFVFIRVMLALSNEFGSVPSSAIFGKSFIRIGISSSLNV